MTTTIPTVSTTSGPPPSAPALTTTFTPASTCTNDFYMLPYQASGFACMVGDESSPCQYLHLGPSNASGCMPPDWSTATNAYYSPGVCPTGYTEACSNLVSVGTVTETRATCCPRYVTQLGDFQGLSNERYPCQLVCLPNRNLLALVRQQWLHQGRQHH